MKTRKCHDYIIKLNAKKYYHCGYNEAVSADGLGAFDYNSIDMGWETKKSAINFIKRCNGDHSIDGDFDWSLYPDAKVVKRTWTITIEE